jgi:hypothetical protein
LLMVGGVGHEHLPDVERAAVVRQDAIMRGQVAICVPARSVPAVGCRAMRVERGNVQGMLRVGVGADAGEFGDELVCRHCLARFLSVLDNRHQTRQACGRKCFCRNLFSITVL